MKILALDGGGVFGFVQARILSEAKCSSKFDAFVGTSIGSAIASAYAFDRGQMVTQNFFDEWMPEIFTTTFWRSINPFMSKYPDGKLNEALRSVFDGLTLGQASKPLFITAANLSAGKLKVYYSGDSADSGLTLWQVLRSATAGETYFDPWQNMADGGVFANNPSMVGVAAVSNIMKTPVEKIELLSIGTGNRSPQRFDIPSNLLGWGRWLIQASLNGAANSMHEYFVCTLPLKKYVRIQFAGKPEWKLDNVAGMKEAEELWEPDIEAAVQAVKDF